MRASTAGREVGHERRAQLAEGAVADLSHQHLELVRPRQQPLGLFQQHAARRRQRHPARRPGQERDAELALERADPLAERRLRHVQARGGTPEMQFLRDGDEVA